MKLIKKPCQNSSSTVQLVKRIQQNFPIRSFQSNVGHYTSTFVRIILYGKRHRG